MRADAFYDRGSTFGVNYISDPRRFLTKIIHNITVFSPENVEFLDIPRRVSVSLSGGVFQVPRKYVLGEE